MKTRIIPLLSFLLFSLALQAQGWVQQSDITGISDIEFFDDQRGWAVNDEALITTQDGGLNWELQWETNIRQVLAVDFTSDETGWLLATATLDHRKILLKTTDGGQTWERLPELDLEGYTTLDFVDNTTGWLIGDFGKILKTSDGGQTWTIQASTVLSHLNDVQFLNPNEGWIVGENRLVLTTNNGGLDWVKVNNLPTSSPTNITTLFVLDADHWWVAGLSRHIVGTVNGGQTWRQWSYSDNARFEDIHFIDESRGWAVGNEGVFRTTNGGTSWQGVSLLDGEQVYFSDELHGYRISFSNLTWTNDGGGTWYGYNHPTLYDRFDLLDFSPSGLVFALEGNYGQVAICGEAGQDLDILYSTLDLELSKCYWIDENLGFLVGSAGFVYTTKYVYKTTDGGQTFYPVYQTEDPIHDLLAISEDEIYLVGKAYSFFGSPDKGYVVKSSDGGETWEYLHTDLDYDIEYVSARSDGTLLFAGTNTLGRITAAGQSIMVTHTIDDFEVLDKSTVGDDHLFYLGWDDELEEFKLVSSNDGGETWSIYLLEGLVELTGIHFVSATEGWAIGNNKFYRTQNGGQTWELVTYIGGSMRAFDMIDGTKAWAGGNGIYFYDDVTPSEEIEPEQWSVKVWPNPAVDQLQITLPENEQILAQLFNLNGQIVGSWDLTEQNITLDIAYLPAGVYWLKITTGKGDVISQKVIKA